MEEEAEEEEDKEQEEEVEDVPEPFWLTDDLLSN